MVFRAARSNSTAGRARSLMAAILKGLFRARGKRGDRLI